MSPIDTARSTTLPGTAPTGLPPADPAATGRTALAAGDELTSLRTRADGGGTLSPVEQGTLARLTDKQAAAKPKTVADFTLIGATKQDRADLKQALDYLQAKDAKGNYLSPTAARLLADLPKGAKLEIVHNGADQYDPSTKTISWDPRSGLQVSGGGGTQSAALGLIHEIDHATHGLRSPKLTGDGYENTEEKRVIVGSETTIAHDLGEPTRTDHFGDLEVMGSSTAHTKVERPDGGKEAGAGETVKDTTESVVDRIRDFFEHLF